ncbi:CHAT domain-containing protein [Streptomyces sp. NBC_00193]|uniref:CHAT domain-containing protein n=1 Tax=Streptomyces sp. NBC_00193 TaxID=2975675 RepID=UPI0022517900|nr:CHAT domain-containing protein [Streptomyces sp. NBC_00193]MCX5299787.1 CHAT domain-containing protein [Streptomyces sp. NBC_00193]
MVDEEEAGGVRAVRAWATGATERAARLIGREDEDHPLSAEEFEGAIAELSRLRHLLDHDRFLLGRVTLVLGVLHAKRHVSDHGTPADPERARQLLDEVRDPATAAGELMTDEGRQWAAMFLLVASSPTQPGRQTAGSPPDKWTVLDRAMAQGPEQNAAEAARVSALAAEIGKLSMLPPELQGQLQQMQDLLSYVEQSDLSDPDAVMTMLPPDFPFRDQLQTLLGLIPPDPDPSAPRAPSTTGPAPTSEPEPAPEPEDQDDITVTNAWLTALLGLSDAMRTGDPESVNHLLQRLGGQLDSLPPGHGRASEIQNLMRMVLQTAAPLGGSLVDSVESLRHTGSVVDHFAQRGTGDPGEAHLAVAARATGLFARMRAAMEMEDEAEFLRLMGELEALEASVPPDHPFHWMLMLLHGSGLTVLGELTHDDETIVRGLDRQEAALAARPRDEAVFPTAQLATVVEGLRVSRAVMSRSPDLMPRPAPPAPGDPTSTWYLAAMTAGLRYSTSQDPADLDDAISGLEHVREEVRQGRSQLLAFSALWQLAEYYRMRLGLARDPADQDAATDAAMESLQALAGDVVLQSGPDHGLLTARTGAERGVQAAIWAASQGRVEEAVAALELGRALVLQAASASRAVPELLEARGHHGLAQEWRAAAPAPEASAPGAGAIPDVLPRELPSSLRRRALEALGHRERDGALFRTPTVDELKAGLAEGDADALVYLLAGEGSTPGMAVVLGPDMGTGVRALPLLSGEKSGPLERFLDASAAYQVRPPAPGAAQTWEDALSELCDWATDAVILPVISGVAERLAANENRRRDRPGGPRIVLVPCGRLGVVPWHAARLPAEAPSDYVCQIMVISYAASGRQFLNTVRRGRRAPADAPVLVADPTMSLPYAELEVVALQQTLYPRARLYGEFYEPPVAPAAAGTPNDLLAALAGAPSLLHVACHGSAGTNPTASALRLAPETDGPADGPGGDRTDDLLTVARLLDHPAGEQNAPDGPLVVLSACETDLSKRDHDEALTLTSAFVANGARDVVGSRWATRDSAAALMMAVFHHYLTVEGLSPVDALHSAQSWMLDPERENPGSLGDSLLEELAGGPELDHPAVWAAFVHQGHPGPSRVRNRARSGS